ncbi:hypothetical protein [Xanthobacter autotrophicus]|uniref:hypothetical protein n=2 Tax=Xanthobacter autotrophicus TaxID=280 RepID=UPI00372709D5
MTIPLSSIHVLSSPSPSLPLITNALVRPAATNAKQKESSMSRSMFPTHAPLPDDPPKMVQAIERLNALGIGFERKTLYQLKIGEWNFYPGRGTIVHDGGLPAQDRGLLALLERLRLPVQNRAKPRHHP